MSRSPLLVLAAACLASGCSRPGPVPEESSPEAGAKVVDRGRSEEGTAAAREAIDRYLAQERTLTRIGPDGEPEGTERVRPYEWFARKPVGAIGAEMMPVILQRILPELAVELGEQDPEDPSQPLFGEPGDDALARYGFWDDPRPEARDFPLPMGFSWTPGREGDAIPLSLAVRTCSGCHTGRVRLDDGSVRILDGAPNTEILLHQYDAAVSGFFDTHLADDRIEQTEQAILRLVDAKHQEDPNFFFRGFEGYDAAEEARQVGVFKAALGLPLEQGGILAAMKAAAGRKLQTVATLEKVAYSKEDSPPIHGGPPGLIDSSGLGIAAFVGPAGLDPAEALYEGATKNDVPAVWNQRTRTQWQWDGNIKHVLARNLVAALGLVGDPRKMDITANVLVSEFIDDLPPAPYPFEAPDAALVERGRALFEANCLACHRDDQREGGWDALPIFDLGTDPNRSRVVRPAGYAVIERAIVASFQPRDLHFRLGDEEFRPNRDVDGDDLLIKRFTPEEQGYVAPPLDGIWARAPYLHNGSVPTMRHLLAPPLRDDARTFVRGAISYDTDDLGWSWEADRLDRLRADDPAARLFDAALDGQSNAGHDQRRWVDDEGKVGPPGRAYRLAWDDPDDPEVDALVAYLKTK